MKLFTLCANVVLHTHWVQAAMADRENNKEARCAAAFVYSGIDLPR